ncbi:nucleotide sugar dehydrogenase [Nocardioides hungaricus]
MKIAVIGLGKIGLPLAAQFASRGHQVTGVDINPVTVETVNSAREPFPGEAFLAERLAELVPTGTLTATTDYATAVPEADVVVVVVPLFVDDTGAPDFGWMDSATREIAANLTEDTLVIYETTLPVGTTRTRWKPLLEQGSGLTEGADFHVAFSPERVLTGRVFADLRKYPKLIGGLSSAGAGLAAHFYRQVLEFDQRPDLTRDNGVWDLGTAEAAELAKLAETTYRDVNIGLANQFAIFAEGIGVDIRKVITAANSQPYSHIHNPGISVGGHCIPIYPQLYMSTHPEATIVRVAREANQAMPGHGVTRLESALGGLTGIRVAVLGAAYRGGVKESAFSGVFSLVAELRRRGAEPRVHDPLYSPQELDELGLPTHQMGTPVDAAILHTDHAEYQDLSDADLPGCRVLVDGRGVLDRSRYSSTRLVVLGVGEQI